MWASFPSLLHPWMDGTKWYVPSLWSDNLGGWDVWISLVTLVDHLLKLLVSKFSALDIGSFWVALLVMIWWKWNWVIELRGMYLRPPWSIALLYHAFAVHNSRWIRKLLVEIYIYIYIYVCMYVCMSVSRLIQFKVQNPPLFFFSEFRRLPVHPWAGQLCISYIR